MPREYYHIQNYEKEISELKSQGYTFVLSEKKSDSHTNKCTISSRDITPINENN